MIVAGLTGGVASGKSLVAKKLKELGATIIDADLIAREVLCPGEAAFDEVVKSFGREILTTGDVIDRKKLGGIVFNNKEKRELLNAITHPRIRERMMARLAQLKNNKDNHNPNGQDVVILDIPLLFESGLTDKVDCVIVVYADVPTQTSRLMQRDGLTEAAALARINSQIPLKDKLKTADYIIDNNAASSETLKETQLLFEKLKNKAEESRQLFPHKS